ncbi:ABC transporter permease [bacterium]|nr:MAG: ABC transporter permease [bacterium]
MSNSITNSSLYQLFLMNSRMLYRNWTGLFFTLVMPVVIYVALSVLPIGDLVGARVSYSQFVLPGIIAMTIMQGGIYSLAYWMIDLKSRNVIKRFLVTPLKTFELIASVLLSRVLVAMAQVLFLSVIGWIFFGATVGSSLWFALGFAALGAPIFLLIGLLISTFADSYEAAAPVTAAIGMPLLFLGNIFYPIEVLPRVFQLIAKLLPTTYLADGIRSVYLNTGTWGDWGHNALILIIWLVVMVVLCGWFFRLKE